MIVSHCSSLDGHLCWIFHELSKCFYLNVKVHKPQYADDPSNKKHLHMVLLINKFLHVCCGYWNCFSTTLRFHILDFCAECFVPDTVMYCAKAVCGWIVMFTINNWPVTLIFWDIVSCSGLVGVISLAPLSKSFNALCSMVLAQSVLLNEYERI